MSNQTNHTSTIKKVLKKLLKYFLFLCAGLLVLVIALFLILQLPSTQQFLTGKLEKFLQKKLSTTVTIEEINISFPKSIFLGQIYIEDLNKDTLWYSNVIEVDLDFLALINKQIQVNSFLMEGVKASVKRETPDTSFNFQFIPNAFTNTKSTPKPKPTEEDTSISNMEIFVYDFSIQNFSYYFDDHITGLKTKGKIGHFNLDEFVFKTRNNSIKIGNTSLVNSTNTTVKYGDPPVNNEPKDTASNLALELETLSLSKINLAYEDLMAKTVSKINLGSFHLKTNKIDLENYLFDIQTIKLTETAIDHWQGKLDSLKAGPEMMDTLITDSSINFKFPLTIQLNKLNFSNNVLAYTNENHEKTKEGFDPNHLNIRNLNIILENTSLKDKYYKTNIKAFDFKEENGFTLQNFKSDISITDTGGFMNNFELNTPHTTIKNHLTFHYSSFDDLMKTPFETEFAQRIYETKIGIRDVLYFNPQLKEIAKITRLPIFLETSATGKLKNLKINSVKVSALKNTEIAFQGDVKGLPDTQNLHFKLDLTGFKTSRKDLLKINPSIESDSLQLPEKISGKIKAEGSLKDLFAEVSLKTSLGNILAKGNLSMPEKKPEQYNVSLEITNFDIGTLVKKSDKMGKLSFNFNLKGKHFDPKLMDAQGQGMLKYFEYDGYTYNNLSLNFQAEKEVYKVSSKLKDQNLDFNLYLDFNHAQKTTKLDFALAKADFKNLGISNKSLEVSGKLTASASGLDPKNISGSLKLSGINIKKEKELQTIEEMVINLDSDPSGTTLNLSSDLVKLDFKSNFSIDNSAKAFKQPLAPYFNLKDTVFTDTIPYDFSFNFSLPQPKLLEETLIPELKKIKIDSFKGNYSSKTNQLEVIIDIPQLTYASMDLDSFKVNISTKKQQIFYTIHALKFNQATTSIHYPKLEGKVGNNKVQSELSINDKNNKNKYQLTTSLEKVDSGFIVKITSNEILLNYENWKVNPENYIFYTDKELKAHLFEISNQKQLFVINTTENKKDAPLEVNFNQFSLATFTNFIQQEDSLSLNGQLDGSVKIDDIFGNPMLNSKLDISNFTYGNDTLGNINLLASSQKPNQYDFEVTIDSKTNKAHINGFYHANSDSVNLDLTIPNFKLASIQPYTDGQLQKMSGLINGNIKVKGAISNPEINGKIHFKNAGMRVSLTNTFYKLKDETILINNNKVDFKSFKIIDKNNSISEINGSVTLKNLEEYLLNLTVDADNFQILNTTKQDNEQYYGRLSLKTNLKVSGTNLQPRIIASLKILEGSYLTFVVPEAKEANYEYSDLMEFVDFDTIKLDTTLIVEEKDTVTSEIKGVDLNASLEIDKNVKFKIVIDPNAGDYLEVSGTSLLSFSMDPTGNMSLSGIYEITDGTYELTYYNLLKRKFNIQKGSNIAWNGDIINAKLNISTKYIVKTSPMPLMEKQINAANKEALNAYKRPLPFEVTLNVKNEMMKPEIDFELHLPEDQKGFQGGAVESKLAQLNQQPSELNKQVFSLLMLNRFIPETSQTTSSGNALSNTARSSVSSMLSQQLNSMAGKYIKGVQLNFELDSYNDNSGEQYEGRTELKLEMSKELFNERLIVSLGSNIDLEGDNKRQNSVSNFAQDVSIEYKLNENGTYRLKGYRKNQYEGVIDGDLTKTGIAFIFTRDYNKLFDLFKKQKSKEN